MFPVDSHVLHKTTEMTVQLKTFFPFNFFPCSRVLRPCLTLRKMLYSVPKNLYFKGLSNFYLRPSPLKFSSEKRRSYIFQDFIISPNIFSPICFYAKEISPNECKIKFFRGKVRVNNHDRKIRIIGLNSCEGILNYNQ